MNRTVFCTFDHRDLADISIGRLKSEVPGVLSVSYVDDGYGGIHENSGYTNTAAAFNLFPAFGTAGYSNAAVRPSRPVTLKIVCNENSQQRVVSKLINLHAYRIVST
ncbi:MAG: hypothetical protein FWH00_01355 [Oscillospiraceae bacterium]|nr:hypothetical protein [Oscillospiraceae bacterium]